MPTVLNKAEQITPLDQTNDERIFDITPSDTLRLASPIQALYVTGAGNVVVQKGIEAPVTLAFLAGGPYFVGGVTRVMATNTTATGIKGVTSKGLR